MSETQGGEVTSYPTYERRNLVTHMVDTSWLEFEKIQKQQSKNFHLYGIHRRVRTPNLSSSGQIRKYRKNPTPYKSNNSLH